MPGSVASGTHRTMNSLSKAAFRAQVLFKLIHFEDRYPKAIKICFAGIFVFI
jgi:hypothetical protein